MCYGFWEVSRNVYFKTMQKYLWALPVLVSMLASCSGRKVTITYNAAYCKTHELKIDDSITLKSDDQQVFLKRQLQEGKHTLSISPGVSVPFEIHENGILNIAREEFVIFPVRFALGEGVSNATLGLPNAVVIDTFAVGSQAFFNSYAAILKKDGIIQRGNGNDKTELVKTDKNQLFINQTWDLDITDEIPTAVQESVSEKATEANAYRKKVLEARQFVRYASETGTFMVVPVNQLPQ